MFGKLIKHEIRHSGRYNLVIYIVALAVVLVMGLSLITESTALGTVSCIAIYLTGMVTVIVTLVSVIKNFYDTLFSRQGYLTLTLPVKGSALLASKVIVSFIWIILGFFIMALTWLAIFFYVRQKTEADLDVIKILLMDSGLLELLPSGAVLAKVIITVAAIAITTILTYVSYIYFAVTVANTRSFQSHPKLFGGLTFFAVFFVISRLNNILTQKAPLTFFVTSEDAFFDFLPMGSVEGAFFSYGVGGTIFTGLVALGLLFVTGYIIEHKVNIK
ncbi:MAG: hypothetical protein IIX36_05075 [Clostridia bacterium]|nr:hypothetical protein [Clostridia bacterium]